jgi:GAF domain-containing protein
MNLSALSLLLADLHKPHQDENETLDSILAIGTKALHCQHAGVMFAYRDRVESVAWTGDLVMRLDELQYSLHEGPCLSAIHEGHIQLVPRTADSPQWPRWGPAAHEQGVESALSVELAGTTADAVGSLNFYNPIEEGFDTADIEVAQILARHVAVVLSVSGRYAAAERALASRTSIGQAQGILMERYSLTGEQAFALLRRYSEETNERLRDVARHVVEDRNVATPPIKPS